MRADNVACGIELGTATDRTNSLGIQQMPPGYFLLQVDSGHYIWTHKNDRDESCIHWNKWAVWRGAWAHHNGQNKGQPA